MSWQSFDSAFPPVSTCLDGLDEIIAVLKANNIPVQQACEESVRQLRTIHGRDNLPLDRTYSMGDFFAPVRASVGSARWMETARAFPLRLIVDLTLEVSSGVSTLLHSGRNEETASKASYTTALLNLAVMCRAILQGGKAGPAESVAHLQHTDLATIEGISESHRQIPHPGAMFGPCARACLDYIALAHSDEAVKRVARQLQEALG